MKEEKEAARASSCSHFGGDASFSLEPRDEAEPCGDFAGTPTTGVLPPGSPLEAPPLLSCLEERRPLGLLSVLSSSASVPLSQPFAVGPLPVSPFGLACSPGFPTLHSLILVAHPPSCFDLLALCAGFFYLLKISNAHRPFFPAQSPSVPGPDPSSLLSHLLGSWHSGPRSPASLESSQPRLLLRSSLCPAHL